MRYWVIALLAVALIGLSGRCHGAIFDYSMESAIVIAGEIVEGDYQRFRTIEMIHPAKVVIVSGPGGKMTEALAIGEYIRDSKIKTIADGPCFSGCAFIWVAGYRLGMLPNAVLGFHGATDPETGLADVASNAVLGKYLSDCGMSFNFIIAAFAGGKDLRIFDFNKIDFMEKTFGLYIFPVRSEEQINFFLRM